MKETTDGPQTVTLLRPSPGGDSSSSVLNRRVQRGELLRLRPGCFVAHEEWKRARLSQRHRTFTAAVALNAPDSVFCGATALSLYDLPLLKWPQEVHRRTLHRGNVRRTDTPYFTVRSYFPLKPARLARPDAEALVRNGELQIPTHDIAVPGVRFQDGVKVKVNVEPLPLVLMDTLPGIARQEAMMVLDAALAGRYGYGKLVTEADLDWAEEMLKTRDVRRWGSLRSFADVRSESPGESRCRVLIDELGFEPPELQKEIYLPRIGRVRLDFWWSGVICEFDGMIKYTRGFTGQAAEEVVQKEKLREDALRMLDYQVVRVTWDDLNDPDSLNRKLLWAGVPQRNQIPLKKAS